MNEELEEEILQEFSSSRCWNQSFIFRIKGISLDLCSACGDNPTTSILASQDPKQFQQPKNTNDDRKDRAKLNNHSFESS